MMNGGAMPGGEGGFNISVDEHGNPYIVLKDQENKSRLKGIDAHRANIMAAKSISDTLRTSFGPKGMDKIIVSPDGDVTVTNDGATILEKMDVEHQCAKLLVELSKSQDEQVGDGTTGVIVLAGALLEHSLVLLEKGIHPSTIYTLFDEAAQIAVKRVNGIAKKRDSTANNYLALHQAAQTALSSKVVASEKNLLSKICVDAVLAVADMERKNVNFDFIRVQPTSSGELKDSHLVSGLVLDKEMSHSQMSKNVQNAKIAILTCPFEPPKPKTKHKLDIASAAELQQLQQAEKDYFTSMVKTVKDSGANFVACQWGFDDEANHLLFQNRLPALRWVGGAELEMLAIATGGRIVGRFQDLKPEKLGTADSVREISSGSENEKFVVIENKSCKAVTIVLHGGNKMVLSEAERAVHDALCCVRNGIFDCNVVAGGGAPEIAAAIAVQNAAENCKGIDRLVYLAFAEALLAIPLALAENSGVDALQSVQAAKAQQIVTNNAAIGVNCDSGGCKDLETAAIFESAASKTHQITLASQLLRMILKIDDIIAPNEI